MKPFIAGAAALLAGCFTAAGSASTNPLRPLEREVFLMGTSAHLLTYAATREQGLATLDRALSILEATEDELSTWRERSAISTLNHQPVGIPWHASSDLCVTFAELFHWHKATGGTFDPGIGSLAEAWAIHERGRIPSAAELESARRTSGLGFLALDQTACTVTRRADVRLDVGAWGKGDALDRVRRRLQDVPWLIDFGGQVAVNGVPPAQVAWTVSLAHPLSREQSFLSLSMRGGSLSTSGGSERDLRVNGRRVAHHLDPRTGEPASFRGTVTVWHKSALTADVLSTALYVMGPDDGTRWAETHRIAACYLMPGADSGVAVRMTPEFRVLLSR